MDLFKKTTFFCLFTSHLVSYPNTGYHQTIDEINATAYQLDGKKVAIGYRKNNDGTFCFAVIRYLINNTIDISFGQKGVAVTDHSIAGGTINLAHALGFQIAEDGSEKIVVAGLSTDQNANAHMSLARFLSNGTLDTSFGPSGTGTLFLPFIAGGNNDCANALIITPDGKIIVGGYSNDEMTHRSHFALAQLLIDGSLDPSFGKNGLLYLDGFIAGGGDDIANALTLQKDGKLIIAGCSKTKRDRGYHIAIARFLNNGSLDIDFGIAGTTYVDYYVAGGKLDVVLQVVTDFDTQYGEYIKTQGLSLDKKGNKRKFTALFSNNGSLIETLLV